MEHSTQNRAHFGPANDLDVIGVTICDTEEPNSRMRMFNAFRDERHFWALRQTRQLQQFQAVANRAQWANQVMANA